MISVIVPVYKVESYIHKCVDSILNQSYTELDIILVDDGSPDHCGKICDEYAKKDCRIRVFHTENRGLSSARNLGLKEAKGDYVGFVDSDDWIEPDMYDTLLKQIEVTGADVIVCGLWYEYETASPILHFVEKVYYFDEAMKALIEGKISNYTWNKIYRRSLFEDVTFPKGNYYEDIEVIQQIVYRAEKISVIDSPKYHYRQRSNSISKNTTAKALIDFANAHFARYMYVKEKYPEIFIDKENDLTLYVANSVSRVWRWWYGCNRKEKQTYENRIKELKFFTREHILLFGSRTWPRYLRISSFFMHFSSRTSFALMYFMNQIYRKVWISKNIE